MASQFESKMKIGDPDFHEFNRDSRTCSLGSSTASARAAIERGSQRVAAAQTPTAELRNQSWSMAQKLISQRTTRRVRLYAGSLPKSCRQRTLAVFGVCRLTCSTTTKPVPRSQDCRDRWSALPSRTTGSSATSAPAGWARCIWPRIRTSSAGCAQVPVAGTRKRSGRRGPPAAGGARRQRTRSSAHRDGLRDRRARWPAVHRHGALRGRNAGGSPRPRSAADGRGRPHRRAGGRRTRRRTRRRHRPPRSQAVEPDADDDGTGQSPRLRAREDRNGRDGDAAHACGQHDGHGGLHVARTGRWRRGGRTVGPLVARRRHYEMLAGRPPFDGTNALAIIQAVLTAPSRAIRTVRPDVAPELEDDRQPDARARPRASARSQRPRCAISHRRATRDCVVRTTTCDRAPVTSRRTRVAAAVVAVAVAASGCRLVGAAQRQGALGAARGAARDRQARRRGQVRRRVSASRSRRSHISRRIHCSPDRSRKSPLAQTSTPIRPAPTSSIVRTAETEPWRQLGTTPVVNARVPDILMHWKAQMAGRETAEDVGPVWEPQADSTSRSSPRTRSRPEWCGSGRRASRSRSFSPALEHLSEVTLPDYWIDRHEVTNRAFKRFVDDGGYRRPELWREPF